MVQASILRNHVGSGAKVTNKSGYSATFIGGSTMSGGLYHHTFK